MRKGTFRCINCGTPAYIDNKTKSHAFHELGNESNVHAIVLTRCKKCSEIVDKYIEFETIIITIDILLLKVEAFRHIIYNRPGDWTMEAKLEIKVIHFVMLSALAKAWLVIKMQNIFVGGLLLNFIAIIVGVEKEEESSSSLPHLNFSRSFCLAELIWLLPMVLSIWNEQFEWTNFLMFQALSALILIYIWRIIAFLQHGRNEQT